MKDSRALAAILRDAGVQFSRHGDRLRVGGPASALTPEVCALLANHKAALLDLLQAETPAPPETPPAKAPPPPRIDIAKAILTRLANAKIGVRLVDGNPVLTFPRDPDIDREEVLAEAGLYHAELTELLTRASAEAQGTLWRPAKRTPWGTVVRSTPGAPPIEAFGPPPVAPVAEPSPPSPDPDPTPLLAPLPWRDVLATWPDPWRKQWGVRANELEDAGHDWREAERLAFDEVSGRPGAPQQSRHVDRSQG